MNWSIKNDVELKHLWSEENKKHKEVVDNLETIKGTKDGNRIIALWRKNNRLLADRNNILEKIRDRMRFLNQKIGLFN